MYYFLKKPIRININNQIKNKCILCSLKYVNIKNKIYLSLNSLLSVKWKALSPVRQRTVRHFDNK